MKRKYLILLSFVLTLPLGSCSFPNSSNGSKDTSSSVPTTEPHIKIIPLNENTPYLGFVNGNNNTKYKVELTNKYGQKSYYNSDNYLLSWESSDRSIVDPRSDKWFVSNGKATITCTYHDYYDEYSDTVEVTSVTRVIEEKSNYIHQLYEVNKEYDLPDSFLPNTSSLFYEISNGEIIRVNETTHKIECLSPGVSTLKVSYYGENYYKGELSSKTYTIDVISEDAPKFFLNDAECHEGDLYAAVNKYTTINPAELGLKAFDKDNNDISNSITLLEGEYNPRELGEYPLTYKVTDQYNHYSYFFATLKIVNRDYTKTSIQEDNLPLDNTILKASVSSSVIKQSGVVFLNKITYQVNVNITDLYDELDTSVTVTVRFQIEDWTTTDHTLRTSSISINGYLSYKTSGSFSDTYEPSNRRLNGNTYQETSKTVRISGYGYNYTYYE